MNNTHVCAYIHCTILQEGNIDVRLYMYVHMYVCTYVCTCVLISPPPPPLPLMQFLDYLGEQPLVIELWGNQSDKDEAFGQVKAPSKRRKNWGKRHKFQGQTSVTKLLATYTHKIRT